MKQLFIAAVALILIAAPLSAEARGHYHKHWNRSERSTPKPPVPVPTIPPATTLVTPQSGEVTLLAYTTGYSWYDNTPAGSAEISHPIIHQSAGGIGTYNDPVTLAVGHSLIGGKDILDYPAGTKFYLPFLKKYVIVEDTCGDGNNPQAGPCHTGYQGNVWLDVYVGKGSSKASSDNCMNVITAVHQVIQNPASTYPVVTGDIAANCTQF